MMGKALQSVTGERSLGKCNGLEVALSGLLNNVAKKVVLNSYLRIVTLKHWKGSIIYRMVPHYSSDYLT